MSFQAEVRSSIGWRWSEGATFDDRLEYVRQWLEAEATGEEAVWMVENRLIEDGDSVTLDLTYLERDVLGDVLVTSLGEVRAMLIINQAPGSGQLCVGGAEVDAWDAPMDGGRMVVAPDGAVMMASRSEPWPVSGSQRNLRLTASGGDVMYAAVLMGRRPGDSSSGQ